MINDLPTEILSEVRKYLNDEDLFRLAQTSRKFRSIIKGSDELWKASLLNKWYRRDLLPPPLPSCNYYAEYLSRTRSDHIIRKKVEAVAEMCPQPDSPEIRALIQELQSSSYGAFYILDKLQNHFGPERSCVVESGGLDYEAYTSEGRLQWLSSRLNNMPVMWVARCCLERLRFQYLCDCVLEAFKEEDVPSDIPGTMLKVCLVDPNFFELNRVRLRVLDKAVANLESQTFCNLKVKANRVWEALLGTIRSEVEFSFDGALFRSSGDRLGFESYCLLRFFSGDNPGCAKVWSVAMWELCHRLNMNANVLMDSLEICEAGEYVCMGGQDDKFIVLNHQTTVLAPPCNDMNSRNRDIYKAIFTQTPPPRRKQELSYVSRIFNGYTYVKVKPISGELIDMQSSMCANYPVVSSSVKALHKLIAYLSSPLLDIFVFRQAAWVERSPFYQRLLSDVLSNSLLKEGKQHRRLAYFIPVSRENYTCTFEVFDLRRMNISLIKTSFEPGCIFQRSFSHTLVVVLYADVRIKSSDDHPSGYEPETEPLIMCYTEKGKLERIHPQGLLPVKSLDSSQALRLAEFDEIGEYFQRYDTQQMKFIPNESLRYLINDAEFDQHRFEMDGVWAWRLDEDEDDDHEND